MCPVTGSPLAQSEVSEDKDLRVEVQNWKLSQAIKGASKSDAFEIVGGNSDDDLELDAEGPGDDDALYDF